jgi:hypothetical protein
MTTLFRHIGGFLLGLLAAILTYTILPLVLAYPTGMLSARAGFSLVPFLYLGVIVVALFVWIAVWIRFTKKGS